MHTKTVRMIFMPPPSKTEINKRVIGVGGQGAKGQHKQAQQQNIFNAGRCSVFLDTNLSPPRKGKHYRRYKENVEPGIG